MFACHWVNAPAPRSSARSRAAKRYGNFGPRLGEQSWPQSGRVRLHKWCRKRAWSHLLFVPTVTAAASRCRPTREVVQLRLTLKDQLCSFARAICVHTSFTVSSEEKTVRRSVRVLQHRDAGSTRHRRSLRPRPSQSLRSAWSIEL